MNIICVDLFCQKQTFVSDDICKYCFSFLVKLRLKVNLNLISYWKLLKASPLKISGVKSWSLLIFLREAWFFTLELDDIKPAWSNWCRKFEAALWLARELDKVQKECLVPGAVLLQQLEHPELDIKPARQTEGRHQALHAPGLGAGAQPENNRGIRN